MTLPEIDPVLIHLGPVAIRWYALAYVVGIGLGWYYILRLLSKYSLWAPKAAPMTPRHLEDLVIWMALGVILGGRIGSTVFYNFDGVMRDPLQFFRIWEGGMSFHGGFIGVVIAGIFFARKYKINPYSLGDLLACAAPIGLFLGRLANFINGELWGRPTEGPLGIIFCNKYIEKMYGFCPAGYLPRHPSQLYEAVLEGLLLFTVLFVLTHTYKKLKTPGLLMGIFIAGYGLSRILVETVRSPDAQMPEFLQGPVTMGMLLSLPMVWVGAYLIYAALIGKTQDKTSDAAA
jgi:phosphatidylglycerol---prolipoprotein diacylglyceryl transferase